MSEEQRVLIDVADHVATVTLNRPDKHNALDGAMFTGIIAAAEEIAATPGVRVVVMHGAGKSFCSGLDVASLATGPVSLSGSGNWQFNKADGSHVVGHFKSSLRRGKWNSIHKMEIFWVVKYRWKD